MVRCAAVELRRHHVCCFVLHPGTVDTELTRAFARARAKYTVRPGLRKGPEGLLALRQDVDEAVGRHLELIRSRTMADSGRFFDWQGQEVPW